MEDESAISSLDIHNLIKQFLEFNGYQQTLSVVKSTENSTENW